MTSTTTDSSSNNNEKSSSSLIIKLGSVESVTMHPLVLLSVADHYHRVARGTRKRVVGVLLGQVTKGGQVDCSNSFAVPFEEDSKNPVRPSAICALS